MSGAVQLRPARPEEAAALSAIAHEAKAALGYGESLLQGWREALSLDPQTIRQELVQVAVCEGMVAGFFCVQMAGAEARLEHLWVKPALQRRGVGRLLMQEALRLAGSRGARCMMIDAEPKAEAFYCRMGFERIGAIAAPIPQAPDRVRPQLRRTLHPLPPGEGK